MRGVQIDTRGRGQLVGVCVLALLFARAAAGLSITALNIAKNPGNSANFFDDVGTVASQVETAPGVPANLGTAFQTWYRAGVYTDAGGTGAVSNTASLLVSYRIEFTVAAAANEGWRLDVTTHRAGALTCLDDGQGQCAVSLGPVTGIVFGIGSLSSGTLGLPGISSGITSISRDIPFDQSEVASIIGEGTGSVILDFGFSATAQTLVLGSGSSAQGDEAAIRMGIPGRLTSFTAGNYPGIGNRTAFDDGHIVSVSLVDRGPIPEPDTALLLGLGLAWIGRRQRGGVDTRARC